ncbi:MAG: tetratricopeptide repeat protein, partial [Acidobacteriales bacterium]
KVYESTLRDFVNLLPKNSFDRLRMEGYMAWRNGDLDTALLRFQEAASLKPSDANIALARAQVLIGKNQFEPAEKLILDLIARDKKNGPAYDVLYAQYLRLNRAADAEKILKDKSGNNPTVIEYRFQLAAHYFQMNQREDAARVVDAVAADRKTFPKGREKAGDFYTAFREFDKAIAFYRGALNGSKEERLDAQRKIADVLVIQGKRDQALKLLENEILKENPKDAVALALRATLWLEMGDRNQLQQAISELETAVGKLPQNAVVRYNLGRAYWAKGQVDSASAQFRAAANMQSNYLMPRLALAQIQLGRSEFAAALQSADEIVAMSPNSMAGRLLRSSALQGMGKSDEARAELQTILKANPTSEEVTFRLGLLEVSLRNYAAAEKIFKQCIANFGGEVVCSAGLAEVYSSQSQYDKALQVLTAGQQKHPERREIRLAFANTYVLAGRYDEAVTMFRQMIAKEPESGDLQLRLAETYRRKGDVAAAIEGFRKVKQMQPNNPNAGIWLALLLHQTGREADAK